ncbi:hypothetical protein PV328_007306 [Microctonus aethiopoides]|uniref:Uncharacterized protein n=1 Tax=Microctonus aethiopoides TaxID=144406 RepID=A0AA39FQY8_9HYME|nr:hypothetical protein PV328_007306 [Microctonus aethiopoides]
MIFPDSSNEDINDMDLSMFCDKNEVIRKSDSVEQHCPLMPYEDVDEMMEYYNEKRLCVCADGYVRHPDGYCSTPQVSLGAPFDHDSSSDSSSKAIVDVFHESSDNKLNYLDKSIFCHKNEVVRTDERREQYCFNHPLAEKDEIDTSLVKSVCICADGYVRHVDGFCSTKNRCFIINRFK